MELLFGFLFDVIGIKTIRKEKNFSKKLMMLLAFPIIGFLLFVVLISI